MNTKCHYVVDFTQAKQELQVEPQQFVEFVNKNFKINGRRGRVAKNVTVEAKDNIVSLESAAISFPKRYVHYLAKKFLSTANNGAYRDAFRLIACPKNKNAYIVKAEVYQNEEAKE